MKQLPIQQDCIYEFQAEKNIVMSYLDQVKSDSNIIYKHTGNFGKADRSEYIKYGYPAPYLESLFSWLEKCVNEVALIKFGEKNQNICDIWVTKSTFMQRTDKHFHSHSIFSGILYLQDHLGKTDFFPTDTFWHTYMNSKIFVDCKKNEYTFSTESNLGKLLIFPSYLIHSVPVIKSKEVRYTLAFNTFFTGKVSNTPTQMLELNLLRNTEKNVNERS